MIIGCKIEKTFQTFKSNHKYFKQVIEQHWWLHSTKGWKRSLKTKTVKEINPYEFYPRISTKIEFRK